MNTTARQNVRRSAARPITTRRLSGKMWRRGEVATPHAARNADDVHVRAEVTLEPWVPREYAL